jgi:Protein of unknown function (DUF1018)
MPLKLNVGVSKKVGLPDYGSAGATCNLELELDAYLLETDLDGFHQRVRSAYVAAQQAVHDELSRLQSPAAPPSSAEIRRAAHDRPAHRNGQAASSSRPAANRTRPSRPATTNQVRAIQTIARRLNADLDGLLREEFGVERLEDLSMSEASRVIDDLKAASES